MKTKRSFLISFIFKFLPATHCHKLKSQLLRWCGAKVGKNVEIFSSAKIIGEMDLYIGDNVFIGHEALIFGAAGSTIKIDNYAKVGSRSVVVTGYHRYSVDGYCVAKEGVYKDVLIESGAVVSTNVIVLPGITIGKMAHVAAGSVVTKDVEPYMRVAGNPARPIRNLLTNEKISR